MYVKNRMASLIYKLVIIFVCFVGLLMNSGFLNGTFAGYVLLYYTIESTLFCLIFYTVATIITALNIQNTGKVGVVRFAPHFKGAVVMSMILNMLVYFFILADSTIAFSSPFALISNMLVHFVAPIMVIVDWAIFDRKGLFNGSDPLIWLSIPFIYYAIVMIASEPHLFYVEYYGGVHYPYRFINPEIIGWAPVLVNVGLLTAAYLAFGYILLAIDRLLGIQAKKREMENIASLFDGKDPNAAVSTSASKPSATGSATGASTITANTVAVGAGVAAATAASQRTPQQPAGKPTTTQPTSTRAAGTPPAATTAARPAGTAPVSAPPTAPTAARPAGTAPAGAPPTAPTAAARPAGTQATGAPPASPTPPK